MIPDTQSYGALTPQPQAAPAGLGALTPPAPAASPMMGAIGAAPPGDISQQIIAYLIQQGLAGGQPGAQQTPTPTPGNAGGAPLQLTPQMIQQIMQQRAAQPQAPLSPTGPGAGLGAIQQAQQGMGIGGR